MNVHSFLAVLALALAPFAQYATEDARLSAPDSGIGTQFGSAVAASGDVAVVGAKYDGERGVLAGAAYVYERVGDTWNFAAKLFPSDVASFDMFGASIALEGERLLIASPGDADLGPDTGAVYAFERQTDGTFLEVDKLTGFLGQPFARFGSSIALDDGMALIGAPFADGFTLGSGAAYSFERQSDGSWNETQRIRPLQGATGDRFGASVAIDGPIVVVGAPTELGTSSGTALLFLRQFDGSWAQNQVLTSSTSSPGDYFGESAAIDDDFIFVGATGDETPIGFRGSVTLFERTPSGFVFENDQLTSSSGWLFGSAMEIDAGRLLIGSTLGDVTSGLTGSGAAHLFESLSGTWSETTTFGPELVAGVSFNRFVHYGSDVALNGDRLLVAAPNPNSISGIGIVYTHELRSLMRGNSEISVTAGGTHELLLRAGSTQAGGTYLMLGSIHGTSPGTPIPNTALTLPLNLDGYTNTVLGGSVVSPLFGVLDGFGNANANITIAPGSSMALVGARAHHAFVTVVFGTSVTVDTVSNAVQVDALP